MYIFGAAALTGGKGWCTLKQNNKAGCKMDILKLLFPRTTCMVCGDALAQGDGLCKACRETLTALPDCIQPEDINMPVGVKGIYALYPHEDTARILVLRMKYAGEFHLPAKLLATGLYDRIKQNNWVVDAVVCVPSSKRHLWSTGYNQAAVLAKALAKQLGIPCHAKALKRKGWHKSQVGLGREARLQNIREQFQMTKASRSLTGKNVLLVDDVFTTGATTKACAEKLLAAGAKEIYIACATVSTFNL